MENISTDTNMTHHSVLEQNCRSSWPKWTCLFANVCGLCSTALWFVVLFPQIWKNFRRKSVRGLSVLWATANFTASLINVFFVFLYASIPLYGQISSVYSPVLELTLLLQFWIYGRFRLKEKIIYAVGCLLLWGIIIVIELLFHVENFAEYGAIFLWCVETFPQIILNMRLHSASGQSVGSAFIAMTGKTTDFIATNSLVLPIQYVIMRYFSTSVAYVNGLQVAWYYGIDLDDQDQEIQSTETLQRDIFDHDNLGYQSSLQSVSESSANGDKRLMSARRPKRHDQSRAVFVIRWLSIGILSVFLVGCVVWFTWNIGSLFGLFAPVSIVCVLGAAKLYFYVCYRKSYALRE